VHFWHSSVVSHRPERRGTCATQRATVGACMSPGALAHTRRHSTPPSNKAFVQINKAFVQINGRPTTAGVILQGWCSEVRRKSWHRRCVHASARPAAAPVQGRGVDEADVAAVEGAGGRANVVDEQRDVLRRERASAALSATRCLGQQGQAVRIGSMHSAV